ncbi:MAG: flotillin family protein [Deltaproteobacteria bacterium]|nr:flotillin family protein [Deltaproteobacteria bacterium]
MAFRNEEEASRARVEALEQELARTREELVHARRRPAALPGGLPGGRWSSAGLATAGVVLIGVAFYCGFVWSGSAGEQTGLVVGSAGAVALVLAIFLALLRRLLIIPAPHEAVVVVGRTRRRPDGTTVGWRAVVGRRVLVVPILEYAHRFDLRPQSIELSLANVPVRRGPPVGIEGSFLVRIAGEAPLLDNAVERFLERDPTEIWAVARQTVEAAIRAVVATLDAEEVKQELLRLAQTVRLEVEEDLTKLGLVVDVLRISRVDPA